MTKKELLRAIEHLPKDAEVNVVVTGTAYAEGKYTTFNQLKVELLLIPLPADREAELSAKTGQEDTAAVSLVGMYNH